MNGLLLNRRFLRWSIILAGGSIALYSMYYHHKPTKYVEYDQLPPPSVLAQMKYNTALRNKRNLKFLLEKVDNLTDVQCKLLSYQIDMKIAIQLANNIFSDLRLLYTGIPDIFWNVDPLTGLLCIIEKLGEEKVDFNDRLNKHNIKKIFSIIGDICRNDPYRFVEYHGLFFLKRLLCIDMSFADEILNNCLLPLSLQLPSFVFFSTGWLPILAKLKRSRQSLLSLSSYRVLMNLLGKEYFGYHILPYYIPSESPVADVIFLHGMRGSGFYTWRQENSSLDVARSPSTIYLQKPNTRDSFTSCCWPRDWLSKDLKFPCRILGIHYDSHNMSVDTIVSNVTEQLRQIRVGNLPIIWIGHSLGGLLVKELLTQTDVFAANTVGIVFYSVPHFGSSIINRTMSFLSLIYRYLMAENPYLSDLHQKFLVTLKMRNIPVLSFCESLPFKFVSASKPVFIVSPTMANIYVGQFIEIPAKNHVTVCKPSSIDAEDYKIFLSFLNDIINNIANQNEFNHILEMCYHVNCPFDEF